MAGNEHIGGEKMICEKICIAQIKAKKSETFHSYWAYKLTW